MLTGVIKNLEAHKAMNRAIISAREQPDSHVRWLGPRTAAVRSRKVAGAECSVRLPEGDGRTEVECNCRAGRRHDMCWHVAKVLLLGGATEKQLLQHMGLFLGSSRGGYKKLQEAMSAEAAPGGGRLRHAGGAAEGSAAAAGQPLSDSHTHVDTPSPDTDPPEEDGAQHEDQLPLQQDDAAGLRDAQDACDAPGTQQPRCTWKLTAAAELKDLAALHARFGLDSSRWPEDSPPFETAVHMLHSFRAEWELFMDSVACGRQPANPLKRIWKGSSSLLDR